ncbi:aldo/keto reductase [Parvularcula sp. LCG005]|uniref:aldo/keto reductase n=1 Tax=Parvularcula sp. LCG005 TaxID=3078805 RepID=UPI002942F682|nr:aldo/keto reductase [Parvularcula sp. LCG005]WOI54735.1 aldo/keto reductase [Parvularcula sp. LCG005]
MQMRRLGKTNLAVSEIGLGCWQFGGDFGPVEEERSMATMAAATKAGVNFFDTADVYGAGKSETLVGRYANEQPHETIVVTKVGRDGALYPDHYDLENVRANIKGSAERLGGQPIELVQLHCVPPDVLKAGDLFDVMETLKSDGLIRHWGASVETIEEAKTCLAHSGCATLQIIYNVFRQDATWDLLKDAHRADVGVIVRLPLASGLLTGKFSKDQHFDKTDHRNYNKDGDAFSVGETFNGIKLEKGVELVEELKGFVPDGMPMAAFALRWILDHEAVSTVIAGASRPEQVEMNANVSNMPPLPAELHEQLAAFYKEKVREHIRSDI